MSVSNDQSKVEQLKRELFDLQDKRKKIEDEIKLNKIVLENNKVGMKDSLTDKDDYPRTDIDVFAVRQARSKIIHLENDAKSLIDVMQSKLEDLHSLSKWSWKKRAKKNKIMDWFDIQHFTNIYFDKLIFNANVIIQKEDNTWYKKGVILILRNTPKPFDKFTMEMIIRSFHDDAYKQYTDKVLQYHELDGLFEEAAAAAVPTNNNNNNNSTTDYSGKFLKEIIYLTGNANKLAELERSLQPMPKHLHLTTRDEDLCEIQHSDPLVIAQDKCLRAWKHIVKSSRKGAPLSEAEDEQQQLLNSAILVEDTSLNFRALGGLPGHYIKCK